MNCTLKVWCSLESSQRTTTTQHSAVTVTVAVSESEGEGDCGAVSDGVLLPLVVTLSLTVTPYQVSLTVNCGKISTCRFLQI